MKQRDLGELGEAALRTWAAQAGLIANPASRDKGGWDFYIQQTNPTEPAPIPDSLDHLTGSTECLIQVKATDTKTPPKVKLSNWHRFCQSPLPSFFLVIEFNNKDTPQSAYLVHVGKRLIGAFLKKMRELPLDQSQKLHLHNMRLTWGEKDKLDTLDGHALKAALKKHTGTSPDLYRRKKENWRKTVGYTDRRLTGSFTIQAESHNQLEEQIIEFSLGKTPKLPVHSLNISELRFGIPKPLHSTASDIAFLELDARQNKESLLTFNLGPQISRFKCKTYTSFAILNQINTEKTRLRFVSDVLDCTLHTNTQANTARLEFSSLSIDHDTLISLSSLENHLELASMLDKARRKADSPLQLSISTGESKPIKLTFNKFALPDDFSDPFLAEAVSNTRHLLSALKLAPETQVSINQLLKTRLKLRACRTILGNSTWQFIMTGHLSTTPHDGIELGYPVVIATHIGSTPVIMTAACYGPPQITGQITDETPAFILRASVHHLQTQIFEKTPESYPVSEHKAEAQEWLRRRGVSIIHDTESSTDSIELQRTQDAGEDEA